MSIRIIDTDQLNAAMADAVTASTVEQPAEQLGLMVYRLIEAHADRYHIGIDHVALTVLQRALDQMSSHQRERVLGALQ